VFVSLEENKMSEELRFASTEEAMQYLSDITGRMVKVASEESFNDIDDVTEKINNKLNSINSSIKTINRKVSQLIDNTINNAFFYQQDHEDFDKEAFEDVVKVYKKLSELDTEISEISK
jgi:chaperonin cofactor prefoldin